MMDRREFVGALVGIGLEALAKPARASEPLPVLGVSHGAPLFATHDEKRIALLRAWGRTLPRPTGIVVVTPHFGTRRLALGSTKRGFAMFNLPLPMKRQIPRDLDYPSPPSRELALRIESLLGKKLDRPERRGFDHTTWMPLACLFPAADVPVIELSYPYVPEHEAFELGKKLAPLSEEGVSFVASGGITHNLASIQLNEGASTIEPAASVPSWSREFDEWAAGSFAKLDADRLVDWRHEAPAARLAHPDDGGHYRVFLIALGFALGRRTASGAVSFPITGFESTLSIRCLTLA